MERIIIIDDNNCKRELSDFLEANKEHIRFNTSLNNIKSSAKGFFEELTAELGYEEKLAISSNQNIEIVHTRDITHLEDFDQKTKLYFSNNTFIETSSNLDSFMNKLKGSNFIRVHYNYIINFDYFSKLIISETPTVVLNNRKTIPVNPDVIDGLLNYINDIESNK
jgi:DNA-binding LytR/AlgR family response regulator